MLSMGLGEKCDLFLKSKYAFGDEGRPPKIPGKASVVFNVELLEIAGRKASTPVVVEAADAELIEKAKAHKTEGNEKFKQKSYKDAARLYRETIDLLDMIDKPEEVKDYKEVRVSVHQNLAMTLNFLEEYDEAIQNCDEALQINDKAAKALYIKSQSYEKQKELEKAIKALK